ncbi:hypothetical protein WNB94_06660 [Aquabacterium sp. A3]|uniref:hypothetical protein n=1 Tax=Aquabacterium sp. A3 TaxID=3132829 RepID=UPI00311A7968
MARGDHRHDQRGFSYLMLLGWVALSGVLLMAASTHWRQQAQREREMEYAFRGEQIRRAISAYAAVPLSTGQSPWPQSLNDLLADERTGQVVRHLRQVWPDPMTGQDWGLIRQGQGIRGVYSVSALTPLSAPKGVARFDEWRFEADPPPAAPRQQTVTTAP